MAIRRLDRVVPAAPDKPRRAGAEASQQLARTLAGRPETWTPEQAHAMAARFDELAPIWDAERGGYRRVPLVDALARGGPWPAGPCVEVGSGTGLLTPMLAELWRPVVCLDLSAAMLARARDGLCVRADASRLPVADGRAAAVVIGDAPLFAGEVVRVLSISGVVVWLNALGSEAPFHVPTGAVVEAVSSASGGHPWSAVESEAGWGSWAVLRRELAG